MVHRYHASYIISLFAQIVNDLSNLLKTIVLIKNRCLMWKHLFCYSPLYRSLHNSCPKTSILVPT